jgi:lipopolysaccharide transport system ATP-binding protein
MAAIEKLCTKLIVLKEGLVHFKGLVQEGIQNYIKGTNDKIFNKLFERTDRKGGIKFKFTSLEIYSKVNNSKLPPQTGKNLIIRLQYKAIEELKNVIIRIIIVSQKEIVKFVCNNYHSSEPFPLIDKEGLLECSIPKLPLMPGLYFIHLQCLANSVLYDEIDYAGKFNVESGDFFKTGKVPKRIDAVLIDHQIKYKGRIE